MIKSAPAEGMVRKRLVEKNRGHRHVYLASHHDLEKYLSTGCAAAACGGDIELLRDEKMPELIEGYRCAKCGLEIFYDGYLFHLEE